MVRVMIKKNKPAETLLPNLNVQKTTNGIVQNLAKERPSLSPDGKPDGEPAKITAPVVRSFGTTA
jgi:hypothetical protein